MNENKGIMPTKIELTLEQSQQGVSNDVLVSIEGVEELKRNVWIKGVKKEALHTTLGRDRVGPHGTRASRFKNHESSNLKTKTFANSDIQDLPSRYQDYQDKDCQRRLLASFLDDAKYEHVGQDIRSQGGKDLKEKDLKISDQNTMSKDSDKGSRSKITKHEGTSLQHNKDQRLKNSTTKQSQ
ncbi:hypothetical protein Tco_0913455 [Tanacetum coccineum]